MMPRNMHANIFALNEEIFTFKSYCHRLAAMVRIFRKQTINP